MSVLGEWTNELGSVLTIESVDSGLITGTYTTAVSAGACAKGVFGVTGRTDVDSDGSSAAWSVVWRNEQSDCHSSTAWAGQFNIETGLLAAFWLLSSQSDEPEAWAATSLGIDTFSQGGPPKGEGGRPLTSGRSHP
jgi:hypothetical protein